LHDPAGFSLMRLLTQLIRIVIFDDLPKWAYIAECVSCLVNENLGGLYDFDYRPSVKQRVAFCVLPKSWHILDWTGEQSCGISASVICERSCPTYCFVLKNVLIHR